MTPPSRVRVELGARSYDIVVGCGLLDAAGEHLRAVVHEDRVLVVCDETVASRHLPRFEAGLARAGIATRAAILPPGEATKSWDRLGRLIEWMVGERLERRSIVVALGGGVIGDLTGLAASLALRGVDFVQVPTTLLAQVDSSVGGKTAVNTAHGKNLIGTFHQPRLVLADIDTLATLPERELRAGYAEVVKYGLINDPGFFAWLEAHGPALLGGNAAARVEAVATSCRSKARIVAADERETGERALLNLGHTFGHALEKATGFGSALLHGEAVAIGMVLAFDLSAALGLCPPADAARVRSHLNSVGLPVTAPVVGGHRLDAGFLLELMHHDKKVSGGRVTFVLARGIGQAFVCRDLDEARVEALLARALAA